VRAEDIKPPLELRLNVMSARISATGDGIQRTAPHKLEAGEGPAMKSVLAAILCLALATSATGQQAQPLSKDALKVKQQVAALAVGAPISVIRRGAPEEYGTFVSAEADSFSFYDVDSKQQIQLKFEDVRKVKNGYGGYNSLRQHHVDRDKSRIIGIAVVGGLLALTFGAVLASK